MENTETMKISPKSVLSLHSVVEQYMSSLLVFNLHSAFLRLAPCGWLSGDHEISATLTFIYCGVQLTGRTRELMLHFWQAVGRPPRRRRGGVALIDSRLVKAHGQLVLTI